MLIARVFARKTNMTPTDEHAYYDVPDLFSPVYDEVYVSCTFTWDKKRAEFLKTAWGNHGKKVYIGGPAYDDKGGEFHPCMFLKPGVTITSRGCDAHCKFCFVPKREGKCREIGIKVGNIIQDNNLLACSRGHVESVFKMLKTQKNIDFTGGLDVVRLKSWHLDLLFGLKIYQMWFAFDDNRKRAIFKDIIGRVAKYFKRDQIRAYVLIGYEGDTVAKAEERLRFAWDCGTLPFAMRYRTLSSTWESSYLYPEREWNLLTRQWTRPAIIKSINKINMGDVNAW